MDRNKNIDSPAKVALSNGRLTGNKIKDWLNEEFIRLELFGYEVYDVVQTRFSIDQIQAGACSLYIRYRNKSDKDISGTFYCFYSIGSLHDYINNGYELYIKFPYKVFSIRDFELDIRRTDGRPSITRPINAVIDDQVSKSGLGSYIDSIRPVELIEENTQTEQETVTFDTFVNDTITKFHHIRVGVAGGDPPFDYVYLKVSKDEVIETIQHMKAYVTFSIMFNSKVQPHLEDVLYIHRINQTITD